MSDFSDDLLEQLNKSVIGRISYDNALKKLTETIKQSADYSDAYEYANRYGEQIAKAIESLGINEWLFGTALEVWSPALKVMSQNINQACRLIQRNKNKLAGMGLNPKVVKFVEDNVRDMIFTVSENPALLSTSIMTYAEKLVDHNQKANADFMINSGIPIIVTRTYDGVGLRRGTKSAESCEWCERLAGVYQFSSVKDASDSEVFARHNGCHCSIDYENKTTGTRTIKYGY